MLETEQNRFVYHIVVYFVVFMLMILMGYNLRRWFTFKQERKLIRIADKKRRQAENDMKIKSLFLQNMSHDIRTPLNAILGFNELLHNDDCELEPGEKKEFLGLIQDNTDMLLMLINDIVNISEVQSGTYRKILSEIDVTSLCNNVLAIVSGLAVSGVEVKLEEPSDEQSRNLVLYTDKARVQQALINYLTNACKYTEMGTITLAYSLTQNGQSILFTVADTGPGIPTKEAEAIFDRFRMLNKSKKGTGLGLNICLLIADLLEGRTWLDTTYTDGARFCFEIPIRQQPNEPINQQS